ncbi:MAG TPA: cation transporter [Nocardioidaceae bacterium]|nr:cation transporter [Nocardioidaceae bacterium]
MTSTSQPIGTDRDGTTTTYAVQGMTCSHCVHAVTDEITALGGIHAVEVDLDTGLVTVSSARPLDRAAVSAAVDEAGYRLA